MLGLVPPSGGSVRVFDLDPVTQTDRVRARVGYMPENDCLPPDVSAAEFVTHLGRMSGLPRTAARERASEALRHVGLYEERYRQIGGYSTGMKQRVKLAQALVHDPDLVLLDEPTNGLDPAGRDDMLDLVRRASTEFGISVLVTSHLLGELERVSDHVVVLDNGRLLRTIPISAGAPGFITRSGVKVIIEKFRSKTMDAATTGVDPGDPEYYNIENVEYAQRVTYSGEFLHAAPWSVGSQGAANVSHGCVGMSTEAAAWLYGLTKRGDVVDVTGSDRPMEPTNGWGDWNVPWDQYREGSALS